MQKKIKTKKKLAWINVNVFKAGYNMDFNSRYYSKMDYIVPVSDVLHKMLVDGLPEFREKYRCIYDILNPHLIRKMGNECIAEASIFKDKLSILTVGRLAPQKNYPLAIDTAGVLRGKGLDFYWYIIGEGGEEEKLRRKINEMGLEKHVVLLGLKTNPYAYMKRCSIYVQTSSFEGFGLTIAEAKILHKPIVSTNFDVVRNQIRDGENGLIAEMNKDSLSGRILELIDSTSLREKLINNLEKEKTLIYAT